MVASTRGTDANGLPATWRQLYVQHGGRAHGARADRDCLGIVPPAGVRSVGVDLGDVRATVRQERERKIEGARLLVGDGPDEPFILAACLPRDRYIIADATGEHARRIPVDGDVPDEPKRRLVCVVLDE